MTFDDDFVRLYLVTGTRNIPLKDLHLEWPPPERLTIMGEDMPLVRVSMSELTDEQRAGMTNVCRGAGYEYEATL